MTRVCTVCHHKNTAAIDRALATRAGSYRAIASQFSLNREALRRHLKEHLPLTLALGHRAGEVSRADDLLAELRSMQDKTIDLLEQAEDAGELRVALGAIREARSNIELLARLLGKIQERPVVINNIIIDDRARDAIINALRPYPFAGYAVSDALGELEERE